MGTVCLNMKRRDFIKVLGVVPAIPMAGSIGVIDTTYHQVSGDDDGLFTYEHRGGYSRVTRYDIHTREITMRAPRWIKV